METTHVELNLNDVDALIADLETDFAELRELTPSAAMPLTNNSCCGRASCHTF